MFCHAIELSMKLTSSFHNNGTQPGVRVEAEPGQPDLSADCRHKQGESCYEHICELRAYVNSQI